MNKLVKTLVAVLPFLVAVGCVDPAKEPAQIVIKAGEAAVANLTAEVEKLAPEQSKAARDALAAAKAAAAKDDWKGAHAIGKDVAMTVAQAVQTAKAKKAAFEQAAAAKAAELKAAWEQAQKDVPAKLEAMKKHLAKLAKSKKLPKGVTKDAVTKAKADVAELEVQFAKAAETAKADVQAAGAAAKDLVQRASATAASIGM
jgi:colicin import membrane protein